MNLLGTVQSAEDTAASLLYPVGGARFDSASGLRVATNAVKT